MASANNIDVEAILQEVRNCAVMKAMANVFVHGPALRC